jgi:hypothetical protein
MLLNPTQFYFPQGQVPQFGAGPFGQATGYGQYGTSGLESAGLFGQHPSLIGQPSPFALNPYLQQFSPWQQAQHPWANSGTQHAGGLGPLQQIIPTLGQLAQQVSAHSLVTQQIGMVLQQLTQQIAIAAAMAQQGAFASSGFGLGQLQQTGMPFAGAIGAQPFGAGPFSTTAQGGYAGFSPQAATQGWGAPRPQTVQ